MNEKEIIELPPQCFVCREFSYKEGADELYRCRVNCMCTNDIYDMWEECPYIQKKYLVRENNVWIERCDLLERYIESKGLAEECVAWMQEQYEDGTED